METKTKERERAYPESKMVQKLKWDSEKKTLQVMFFNGAMYIYLDIPDKVAEAAFNAISIGKFVQQEIKGVYDFEKLNQW